MTPSRMPAPPLAERRPVVLARHGDSVVDEYAWLRDRDDPAVLAYLEAENAFTDRALVHTRGLQERLYDAARARVQETDASAPVPRGAWSYYSRTVEGNQYRIHCRVGADGVEQVLLDENALAAGHEHFALGGFAVSPDQRLLAYATDVTGDEVCTLRFIDLDSGRDLPDEVTGVDGSLAWANDNRTVFYTVLDDAMRPWRLRRHVLGQDSDEDQVVLEEPDGRFYLGVARTRSDAFVVVEAHSKVTSQLWVLDADDPQGPLRCVVPRRQEVECALDHHGDRFYLLTNADGATNFKLCAAPVDDPDPARWRVVIAHRDDVMLEDLDCFSAHLVCTERAEAVTRLRVVPLPGGEPDTATAHVISQPEAVCTVRPAANLEFDTPSLRYHYTSLVTPPSVFSYHMDSRERRLLKQQPVLGGFDPAAYATRREWARASDGTAVPVSLVHRADLEPDGSHACVLGAYGAYGISMDPAFSPLRLSLLDRGVVVAIAHVRGGGELGRRWYERGKYLDKPNTFSDCVATAEHLVARGWSAPDGLALRGGSAGGLLVGAVINQRPDLFRAAVAQVPFVDIVSTMLDETLPLTVIEREEWGDPRERTYYEAMLGYSPYDNVHTMRYPDLLVTAGLHDPRVGFWEPAKWVARLRARSPQSRVLLQTELGAGHAGPSGRYSAWRREALVQAFLLDALGVAGA